MGQEATGSAVDAVFLADGGFWGRSPVAVTDPFRECLHPEYVAAARS